MFSVISFQYETFNPSYAFTMKGPVTSLHLLITPKVHIQNAVRPFTFHNKLRIALTIVFQATLSGPKDAQIIREMLAVARSSLGGFASDARYCFHIPPFNSIDHLHLHAIAHVHEMNFLGWLKYYPGSFWCRSAEDVIRSLENSADRPDAASTSSNGGAGVSKL